ncbi:MAG: YigZ family protein [Oscillospiraceae bacterium]|nr:YigZ family protein [Oscillospiraceae bacterium]
MKRSRFIARLYRCGSETEARETLHAVKTEYRNASHWVHAYALGEILRCSDNGEPPGTAGLPVLNALRSAKLDGVVCVVTRWFGGTKLGVDGLRAAYRAAALAVIELANS